MKESVQRAFSYLQAQEGRARHRARPRHLRPPRRGDRPAGNRVEAELGVAFFVACYSALRKAPVSPALLVLGDMSVQGNIKPLRSLTEPLQVAKDNGAKRALIPIENKRNFLDVSADIMEQVDPIFYGDPKTAAMKVLGGASGMATSAKRSANHRRSSKKRLLRFRLRLLNKTAVEVSAYSKEDARALARDQLGPAVKRATYRFPVRAVYQLKAAPGRRDPQGIEDVSELRALMLDTFRRYKGSAGQGATWRKGKQVLTFTPNPIRRKGPFGQRARYR